MTESNPSAKVQEAASAAKAVSGGEATRLVDVQQQENAPVLIGAAPTLRSTPVELPAFQPSVQDFAPLSEQPDRRGPISRGTITTAEIRTLSEAPEIVNILGMAYALGAVGFGISAVLGLLAIPGLAGTRAAANGMMIGELLRVTGDLCVCGLLVWLVISFGKGVKAAYHVQFGLAALGILSIFGVPVLPFLLAGPLAGALILYFWREPPVRAWFEIDGRPTLDGYVKR